MSITSTLTTTLSPTERSFSITPGDGATFPKEGSYFPVQVTEGAVGEYMLATRRTDLFYVTRDVDGKGSSAFTTAATVRLSVGTEWLDPDVLLLTLTEADAVLKHVVPGTALASKAVILDSTGQIGGMKRKVTAYSADGVVAIADGIAKITKGTAAALTLANPAAGDEGTELVFTSQTAAAHTVSNAAGAGFNAGGASSDVATFGGAIGDGFRVVAINGKWNIVTVRNVTLG